MKSDKTLLIIEDDPSFAMMVELMLEGSGWQIAFANSSDDAKALVQEKAFKCIVSDWHIPGVDSLADIFQLALKSNPETKFILVSGAEEEIIRSSLTNIRFNFLKKPIEIADLLSLID